jgi:cytochrome c oxidase subunit 2
MPIDRETKAGPAPACALCHQIRGTVAHRYVAPDLTHIGSRLAIASNSYANNDANLEAWVTNAQSLKPGADMPDLAAFDGTDIRALVAFLRQLK